MSLLSIFNLFSHFLNIWNTVKIIVLKSLLFIPSSVLFWSQFWFIDFSHQDGLYFPASMHIWLFFYWMLDIVMEKAMAPHSSTLAWKIPLDGGAWKAAVHGVAEGWTRLRDFTFTFHFHALEKEMATHSSVLAWRIPGMGEPGGLPSMGSHRVRHDWSDLAAYITLLEE